MLLGNTEGVKVVSIRYIDSPPHVGENRAQAIIEESKEEGKYDRIETDNDEEKN